MMLILIKKVGNFTEIWISDENIIKLKNFTYRAESREIDINSEINPIKFKL